jgi:hypothetical protein
MPPFTSAWMAIILLPMPIVLRFITLSPSSLSAERLS